MKYRHEFKFLVKDYQLDILRERLQLVMRYDSNQKDKSYSIRSLYFDDLQNTCYHENESGIDNRSKFRLRIYDGKTDIIKLEKKSKKRNMTQKESVSISKDECIQYLRGNFLADEIQENMLMKELYVKNRMFGMQIKTIVEYERTAFVEKIGNVRITFDRNISASDQLEFF